MCYNNQISSIPIATTHRTHTGIAFASAAVTLGILFAWAGVPGHPVPTFGQEPGVCGDTSVDAGEQCDDGNLTNGDGCSSSCILEICGNGVVNVGEQCDDHNTASGDGCNANCRIEFCGDRVVQHGLGEQCDDGNHVNGDGCSSSCTITAAPSQQQQQAPDQQAAPDETQSQLSPQLVSLQNQAIAITPFLNSPDGQVYKEYLSREENVELEQIVQKIKNGRRLNEIERAWAQAIYDKMVLARDTERARYTDLLKSFISTDISAEVVAEQNLSADHLVDVEVQTAINELQKSVDVIRRGELQAKVQEDLSKLIRQRVALTGVPDNLAQLLSSGSQPIEVFATLKALKESAEGFATKDLDASLAVIRQQTTAVKDALPILSREYGIDPAEALGMLDDIDRIAGESTKYDVSRVISAINRFLALLERKGHLSLDLAIGFEADRAVAAQTAARIAAAAGVRLGTTADTVEESLPAIAEVADQAPEVLRPAFDEGTVAQQRSQLIRYLSTNQQVNLLRTMLTDNGVTEFEDRYATLSAAIAAIGKPDQTDPCSADMQAGMTCIQQYMTDLQAGARSQSLWLEFIGFLQDIFGIGA